MSYVGIGNRQDYIADFPTQSFNGDGSTTTFTLNFEAVTGSVRVAVDNVLQPADGTSYYTNGNSITFTSAPATGTANITVTYLGTVRNVSSVSDGAITTAKLADGNITTAKLADSAVTVAKLSYDYNAYRNIIINGDMSIAQRGTSVTGSTSSGYLTVDRWNFARVGGATFSHSQTTDVPTGQGFANSYKIESTTGDGAMGASELNLLSQYFEAQNLNSLKWGTSSAESITLSFWVKATVTGTYIVEFYNNDNSGDQLSASYTINSANTWEKKNITVVGYTSGAFGNDNNTGMQINWWLGAGSDFQSGSLTGTWRTYADGNRAVGQVNTFENNNNTFYLTGVQLEADTSASDFEFLPYDVNLQRCMRYYQTYQSGGMICWSGTTISGANYFQDVRHVVPMRTSATIGNLTVENRNGFNTSNPSIDYGNTQGFRATLQSNANTNEAYFRFKYTADAEL